VPVLVTPWNPEPTPAGNLIPQLMSAPEGIRTPNLLTYSAVSQGLGESLRIWLSQAFHASRAIPI